MPMTSPCPARQGLALSYEEHTSTAFEAVMGANFAQGIHFDGGYTLILSFGVALGTTSWATPTIRRCNFDPLCGCDQQHLQHLSGNPTKDAVEIQGAISLQIPGGLKVFVDGRHYESIGSSNGSSQDRIGAGLSYEF